MAETPKKYTYKPRSKKRLQQLALQDAMRCAGCQVPPYFLLQSTRTRVVGLYILAINTISDILHLDIKIVNNKLITKYHYLARGGKYRRAKRVGTYQDSQTNSDVGTTSPLDSDICNEDTLTYPWAMSSCAPGADKMSSP